MMGQKQLVSLVTGAATLLGHAAGGRRPHLDECLSRVIHAFYRIPRVTRAMTLLVVLSPSGGLLLHLRSRLGNQEGPVRQSTFSPLPDQYLSTPPWFLLSLSSPRICLHLHLR